MKESNLRPEVGLNMQSSARAISDICRSMKLFFGASYQRGDSWSTEDKVKLLDSIFSEMDIGSVILVEVDTRIIFAPSVLTVESD